MYVESQCNSYYCVKNITIDFIQLKTFPPHYNYEIKKIAIIM